MKRLSLVILIFTLILQAKAQPYKDPGIPVFLLRHFDASQNKYVVEKEKCDFLVGTSSKDIYKTVPVVVN